MEEQKQPQTLSAKSPFFATRDGILLTQSTHINTLLFVQNRQNQHPNKTKCIKKALLFSSGKPSDHLESSSSINTNKSQKRPAHNAIMSRFSPHQIKHKQRQNIYQITTKNIQKKYGKKNIQSEGERREMEILPT